MARRRPLVVLTVALALAAPGAALADSAGDNQSSDPFGNNSPPKQTTTAPATTPAPSTPAPSTAPASTHSAGTATDPNGQLPRTGLDLREVGGIGVLLLGSGVLLRRRLGRS
jgi:hypothetical protein